MLSGVCCRDSSSAGGRASLVFEGPSESSHPIGRSSKPNGSVLRRTARLKNRYTLGGAILIPWVAVRCSAISRHVCLARLIRRISSRYGRRMLRNGRGRDESPLIAWYHIETDTSRKHGLDVFVIVCARYQGISGYYPNKQKNCKAALTTAKKTKRALAAVNAS